MNDYKKSDYLQELMDQVIQENPEFAYLDSAKIICLRADKDKKSNGKTIFADCTKFNDKVKAVCPYNFAIAFYESGLALRPEIQYRLMYHELMHVGYDPETGDCRIIPHDLEDFRAVINKWGTDWVWE